MSPDHICLRTSILNLARMIPTSEEEVQKLGEILDIFIEKSEK